MLQERQPLSTAVYQAGSDLRQELEEQPSEQEGEARDPSPGLEARQDFRSIVGGYIYRLHVAPRRKRHVPKYDFPIPLTYVDVQRQNNKP